MQDKIDAHQLSSISLQNSGNGQAAHAHREAAQRLRAASESKNEKPKKDAESFSREVHSSYPVTSKHVEHGKEIVAKISHGEAAFKHSNHAKHLLGSENYDEAIHHIEAAKLHKEAVTNPKVRAKALKHPLTVKNNYYKEDAIKIN